MKQEQIINSLNLIRNQLDIIQASLASDANEDVVSESKPLYKPWISKEADKLDQLDLNGQRPASSYTEAERYPLSNTVAQLDYIMKAATKPSDYITSVLNKFGVTSFSASTPPEIVSDAYRYMWDRNKFKNKLAINLETSPFYRGPKR